MKYGYWPFVFKIKTKYGEESLSSTQQLWYFKIGHYHFFRPQFTISTLPYDLTLYSLGTWTSVFK
jgi:hypothetical protein